MAKPTARAQSEKLFNLQAQGDKYARLLVAQKAQLRQLDTEWNRVTEELRELRLQRRQCDQRRGGANAVRQKINDEERELMKLETRLAACRTRESKMIAFNNELKEKVDALRANRVLAQQVFEKNQKQLGEIQNHMQEEFALSTQIMGEYDKIVSQVHAISAHNINEKEKFDHLYESLANIIRRERENAEAYRKQVLESDPLDINENIGSPPQEEHSLKRTLRNLDTSWVENKQSISSMNERLKLFETTFSSIMESLNISNIYEIIDVYMKREEENFELFRYIQNINSEAEQIENDKSKLETEMQLVKTQIEESSLNARKRTLDDLAETRNKLSRDNTEAMRLRTILNREFEPIAKALERLYNTLGCNDIIANTGSGGGENSNDDGSRNSKSTSDQGGLMARVSSMNELLAAHGVTDGNVLQILGIVEQRSCEIMEQFARVVEATSPDLDLDITLGKLASTSDPNRAVSLAKSNIPECSLALSCLVNPRPGTGVGTPYSLNSSIELEDSSTIEDRVSVDEDDVDYPLSRSELEKQAAKSVAKMNVVSAGKGLQQKGKKNYDWKSSK